MRSHLTLRGRALSDLGVEQVVVAPGPREEEAGGGAGSRLIRLRGPALPYDPTYHLLVRLDRLRQVVKRERPDVLEIHSPYLAALAALSIPRAYFGIRTFVWHSDFIDTHLGPWLSGRFPGGLVRALRAAMWALVRSMAARCEATFVAGLGQAAKLRAHGVPRVVHHPFGVDRATFSPAARDEALRSELLEGSPTGSKLLVGVGRFAVEKQWNVVMEAFARVRARRPAVLVLFGDGPERAALELLARDIAGIRFAGFSQDRAHLAAALASADLLVHGCPFETFGLAVAEALACGTPVVVPDQGGAQESLELAGESVGERYRTGSAAACAAAIERMLERDEASLRQAGVIASQRIPEVRAQNMRQLETYRRLLGKGT